MRSSRDKGLEGIEVTDHHDMLFASIDVVLSLPGPDPCESRVRFGGEVNNAGAYCEPVSTSLDR